jgi:hypothetical protein
MYGTVEVHCHNFLTNDRAPKAPPPGFRSGGKVVSKCNVTVIDFIVTFESFPIWKKERRKEREMLRKKQINKLITKPKIINKI